MFFKTKNLNSKQTNAHEWPPSPQAPPLLSYVSHGPWLSHQHRKTCPHTFPTTKGSPSNLKNTSLAVNSWETFMLPDSCLVSFNNSLVFNYHGQFLCHRI